jgi:hypothetical protein
VEASLTFIDSDAPVSQIGWLPSDESTSIWVYVVDCTLVLGSGLRVELPDQPEAPVVYYGANSALDLSAQQTQLAIAFIPAVAEPRDQQIAVRAVVEASGEEVARRTLVVRNGWMAQVVLGPQSRGGE